MMRTGWGLWGGLLACGVPSVAIAGGPGQEVACDEADQPRAGGVHGHGEVGLTDDHGPQSHDPTYDCAETQDTGYSSGSAFAISLVSLDDDRVEIDTANAFWVMREAAAADGVDIHINSGFRTMADQEYFWMCYQCCCCNDCNQAAQPGYSNHQSGHALDLNTANGAVNSWLLAHGGEYGFTATVPGEAWHWEWWGGGPGGGICGLTSAPVGVVDVTSCESIRGWAQDPDDLDAPVEVRVVFDGELGDPQAIQVPVLAVEPRDDLCDAIGSCNHGFEIEVPMQLRDDAVHAVRVFTVGEDGDSTELAVEPAEVQCSPPVLSGVRRPLPSAAFEAWKFSSLWDLATVDDTALLALDEAPALDPAPVLLTNEDATEYWLLDQGLRRAVADQDVRLAWHLDAGQAVALDAAELAQFSLGTPLEGHPLLATSDGSTRWFIDEPQVDGGPGGDSDGGDAAGSDGGGGGDQGDGSGSGDAGDSGDDGEAAADDAGGCACRTTSGGGQWPVGWLAFGLLVFARRRD